MSMLYADPVSAFFPMLERVRRVSPGEASSFKEYTAEAFRRLRVIDERIQQQQEDAQQSVASRKTLALQDQCRTLFDQVSFQRRQRLPSFGNDSLYQLALTETDRQWFDPPPPLTGTTDEYLNRARLDLERRREAWMHYADFASRSGGDKTHCIIFALAQRIQALESKPSALSAS